MRNLIYCRVSTDKQTTETQIDMCKEIAKKKGGDVLLFVDEGVSSRVPMEKRKQLQLFLDEICEGDLVIVYDLDRIGRDILEGITIYREIKRLGAKITSVTDENCDNELIINIKFSVAQEERRRISERTIHGLKNKQNRLEKVGQVWYGYTLDPNILQTNERSRTFGKPFKLVPEPKEQEAIALMRELYDQGASYQSIADCLTERGIMTRQGTPFFKNSVRRILLRELNHPALQEKPYEWILAAV